MTSELENDRMNLMVALSKAVADVPFALYRAGDEGAMTWLMNAASVVYSQHALIGLALKKHAGELDPQLCRDLTAMNYVTDKLVSVGIGQHLARTGRVCQLAGDHIMSGKMDGHLARGRDAAPEIMAELAKLADDLPWVVPPTSLALVMSSAHGDQDRFPGMQEAVEQAEDMLSRRRAEAPDAASAYAGLPGTGPTAAEAASIDMFMESLADFLSADENRPLLLNTLAANLSAWSLLARMGLTTADALEKATPGGDVRVLTDILEGLASDAMRIGGNLKSDTFLELVAGSVAHAKHEAECDGDKEHHRALARRLVERIYSKRK